MKKIIPHSLALALFAALLTSQPGGSRAQTRKPKGRALLVGIDHYQRAPLVKPTRGAEADAVETAQFIKSQYGFLESEIEVLLGPQATAAAIKAKFQSWLIEGTQPGDRVFFLYAGHGSQIKDTNGDEPDGLDEVLAPYDVNWRGQGFVNVIIDDEIDAWINQLSGRQAVLVFDSCNSGTISRGTPGAAASTAASGDARYLPTPQEALNLGLGVTTRGGKQADYVVSDERLLMPKSGASDSQPRQQSQQQSQQRDLKLVDIKAHSAATSVVVISAAQSSQSAYSMKVGSGQRGALSYVFSEAQQGRNPKLNELRQAVEQRIIELQKNGQLRGGQRPAFEVISTIPLEDKPLFGDQQTIPEVAFANPQSTLRVTLRTLEGKPGKGKQTYRLGEDISYEVTTNAPGWLYLFVFSQEQQATFLFPNEKQRNNYVTKGPHRVPGAGAFIVQEPCGKDVAVTLLSSVDLKLGDKQEMTWQEVFDLLRSKKLTGYVKTRGVGIKKPGQASRPSLDEADWQGASLVIETNDQGSSVKCRRLNQ